MNIILKDVKYVDFKTFRVAYENERNEDRKNRNKFFEQNPRTFSFEQNPRTFSIGNVTLTNVGYVTYNYTMSDKLVEVNGEFVPDTVTLEIQYSPYVKRENLDHDDTVCLSSNRELF